MKEYIVAKSIELNAKPKEVWDALTNPEKTKEYFFKCRVESDWKPGSPISFKRKILLIFNFELKGKILEIEPEKLLKYNLKNSSDDSKTTSTVTDKLSYKDGKTILDITDDVGKGKGAKERYEKSGKGWDKILTGLKEFIESEK